MQRKRLIHRHKHKATVRRLAQFIQVNQPCAVS